jgi:ABC-2 type transport system permease protein
MVFSNLIAIFRKELQGYFSSPFSYIIAAVFWLTSGFFFGFILDDLVLKVSLAEQQGFSLPPLDVPSQFVSSFLGVMISLLFVLLPALSMGLYAEERKRGTLELLATSPITNWVVALGKLLGVVSFFVFLMIPLIIYQIIVFSASEPPIPPQVPLVANVALILLATAILSLGMFVSSLTESSIFAYILTFILVLFLGMADVIANNVGGIAGDVLSYLSLFKHYNDLLKGIFDTSSLVLFASYIFLGIFLTAQSIEALKFQRS